MAACIRVLTAPAIGEVGIEERLFCMVIRQLRELMGNGDMSEEKLFYIS